MKYHNMKLINAEYLRKSIEDCKCLGKQIDIEDVLKMIDMTPVGFDWISVDDRLPKLHKSITPKNVLEMVSDEKKRKYLMAKKSNNVLLALGNDKTISFIVSTGRLIGNEWKLDDWEISKANVWETVYGELKVKYWMPFPEPPERRNE